MGPSTSAVAPGRRAERIFRPVVPECRARQNRTLDVDSRVTHLRRDCVTCVALPVIVNCDQLVLKITQSGFFQQGNRWIDGQAINSTAGTRPDRVVTVGSPEFMQLFEQLTAQNRQGTLSMSGEILLRVGGRNILVKGN